MMRRQALHGARRSLSLVRSTLESFHAIVLAAVSLRSFVLALLFSGVHCEICRRTVIPHRASELPGAGSLLHRSAIQGDATSIRSLLQAGADVDTRCMALPHFISRPCTEELSRSGS